MLLERSGPASLIAGSGLSATSLAVLYAVLVERDLNRRDLTDTQIGKLVMSASRACEEISLGMAESI